MTAAAGPVLAAAIRSFTFHDGEAPALAGLDLAITPGTLTGVLGGSGSGKSTLGRLLAGWLVPGNGGTLDGSLELSGTRLEFDGGSLGRPDRRIDPAQWGRTVGLVPQDPAAMLSTVRATVAEELAFGLENFGVPGADMAAAVQRTAALLGLGELLDRNPARLSGGQLRRLAIGCSAITRPAVLVLDEPFASLDAAGARELSGLVRDLAASGTAVVILSQVVDGLLLEADHWLVLAGGRQVAAGAPGVLGPDTGLVPNAVRRVGAAAPGAAGAVRDSSTGSTATRPCPPDAAAPGAAPVSRPAAGPALELRCVSFGYTADRGGRPPAAHGRRGRDLFLRGRRTRAQGQSTVPLRHVLQDASLAVQPGEIVAVTGPNGAGKSTLLRHLNGLLRPASGTVLVNGADIAGRPVGAVAADVGVLFQHPRDQLFERTLLREVRFGLTGMPGPGTADERAVAALAAVGLGGAAHSHPAELSASGQRLLALAAVLARRPSVMALDEPTVALDGDGLAILDAAVRSAAEAGAAVVLVTHDLDYAQTAAHRIVALDGGRLTGEGGRPRGVRPGL
ncbi:ABC transporter ATP-binding protein [Arthrobacter sp. BHU FT2]|nr:ABC transporter ATP-binding protein [Arthrobacter sp. BHU FT2]